MSFPKIINSANDSSKHAAIIQNTPICQLPVELFFEVLKHLDPITVNKVCSSTCKQFKIILSSQINNGFFRDLFCLHFPNEKINEIENFNLDYKNKTFIPSNIKNGVYVSHRINEAYLHLVSDDKGRLLLSNWDQNHIKILDPKSGECTYISLSHNSGVWSLAASNERLYVGYDGGKIEILDMKTGKSINILDGDYFAASLAVVGENLVAKCGDGKIKILNIKEIETPGVNYQTTVLQDQTVLQNHRGNSPRTTASLITSDGKYVLGISAGALGYSPCNIVIKDLMSQETIGSLTVDKKGPITSLACANEILYVGLHTGDIKVVDLKSLKCVTTLISDKSLLSSTSIQHVGSLAIIDGHLYANHLTGIVTFDFTKNHDIVFKEIAEHLIQTNDSEEIIQNAMQRFSRMPQSQRNRIYEELYLLLKPENHYLGWGEHAFHHQYQLSCSPEVKGVAIMNYLASMTEEKTDLSPVYPPLPVYPLLQCLKIDTDQDYSDQLGCRPGQLKNRGILSLKDLNIICPPSLEIQELSIDLSPTNTNPDVMQLQVSANRNRLGLSNLCNQMLNTITAMDQEAKKCGKILYEGNEPWNELQQHLNDFNTLVEKCERKPHAIIQAFSGDAYAALAKQLNTLIKEFHEVDRKHRITKLRAYTHQEVILEVWTNQKLQSQGILTLSDFQDHYDCSLRQLLHMMEFIEKNV
jgi:WD40 repeat protein